MTFRHALWISPHLCQVSSHKRCPFIGGLHSLPSQNVPFQHFRPMWVCHDSLSMFGLPYFFLPHSKSRLKRPYITVEGPTYDHKEHTVAVRKCVVLKIQLQRTVSLPFRSFEYCCCKSNVIIIHVEHHEKNHGTSVFRLSHFFLIRMLKEHSIHLLLRELIKYCIILDQWSQLIDFSMILFHRRI